MKSKSNFGPAVAIFVTLALGVLAAGVFSSLTPPDAYAQQTNKTSAAPESPAQTALAQTYVSNGPGALGAGVLQIGQLNTLSAAVASATRTQVVAAPTAGSIYLRALWIEKSTTTTGSIIVSYGTGTNCGTGNNVITTLSAASGQTFPFGYQEMEIQIPAQNALCLATDASTTSVRVLAQ
jgi:hypothetical protein